MTIKSCQNCFYCTELDGKLCCIKRLRDYVVCDIVNQTPIKSAKENGRGCEYWREDIAEGIWNANNKC